MSAGSTLRSRVDPSSVAGGHSGAAVNSFIVSRPEHVSSGHVSHAVPVSVGKPEAPAASNNVLFSASQAPAASNNGLFSTTQAPAASNNGLFSAAVTVTQAPAPPAAAQAGDSFANFANFDAQAFESLPAGNKVSEVLKCVMMV